MNLLSNNLVQLVKRNTVVQKIFYSATDERSITTRNNIIYSSLFRGVSMFMGLWMVPLTLNYLNPTKYGIWLTLTSIIAWFNFFDIGLGNGLRNKLAEAFAKKNYEMAKGYVSTTYAILTVIVVVLFVVFILLNKFINWDRLLNVQEVLNEDLSFLMLIVFFFFCFRFVFGLILTILNADQKLAISGFIDLMTAVVSLIGVYIISLTTQESLLLLGVFLSFAPAMVLVIATIWFLQKKYKAIKPSIKYINLKLTKDLTHLSFQFFLLQVVVLLIFFSNNIIIAQLLSPAKVSEFNVVHKYFSIITIVSVLILNPFWTAATDAYYAGDFNWLKKSSSRLIKVWGIISVVTVLMILVSPYVYQIWVKDALQISFRTSLFMGIYVIILSWQNSFVYLINGIGKIRLQLYLYTVMGIAVIPLSYFFIKVLKMGVEGSVMSMIICIIPAAIMIPIQFKLIINEKANGIFNK